MRGCFKPFFFLCWSFLASMQLHLCTFMHVTPCNLLASG